MEGSKALDLQDVSQDLLATEFFLKLRSKSIFTFLKLNEAKKILQKTKVETYLPGQTIRQTSPKQELILVAAGAVAVWEDQSRVGRNSRKVREVTDGQTIELDRFLTGENEWATKWVAETECTILRIGSQALLASLSKTPDLLEYLTIITQNPEIQKLNRDLKLVGVTQAQAQIVVRSLSKMESEDIKSINLNSGALVISIAGELIVRGRVGQHFRSIGHAVGGSYLYIVEKDHDLQIDPSPGAQFWVLKREQWEKFSFKEQFESFLDDVDTVNSVLKSFDKLATNDDKRSRTKNYEQYDDGEDPSSFLSDDEQPIPSKRKMRGLKQHDEMDCGAAVMATIAKFYGKHIGIPRFRSLIQVTREGATLLGLKRGADIVGFRTCGIIAKQYKSVSKLKRPFIALMRRHYIVVYHVSKESVSVFDPAIGPNTITWKEFFNEYSGNSFCLIPTEEFYKQPDSKPFYWKYFTIFKGFGRQWGAISLLAIISFVVGLGMPLIQQFLFDTVLLDRDFNSIDLMAAGLMSIAVFSQVLSWMQSYLTTHFTSAVDVKFTSLFLQKIMSLPMGYYAVRRVGDITTRIGELKKIRAFFSAKPLLLFFNFLSVFVYGSVVAFYNIYIFAVALIFIPIMSGLVIWITPRLTELHAKKYRAQARSSSTAVEQIRGLATLQSLGAETAARWKWMTRILETFELDRKMGYLGSSFNVTAGLLNQSISSVILLMGVYFYIQNELTFGQVMALTALSTQMISPAVALVNEYAQFHEMGVSLARVDDVFTAAPERLQEVTTKVSPDHFLGDIVLEKVSFKYGGELSDNVLNNINMTIAAGETIALVGRSGSGKTTLGHMITGLYQPLHGTIRYGGIDQAQIPLGQLRTSVGAIIQENTIFSGTIFDNVTMGDPQATYQKAVDAAKRADCLDFILELPNGFHTDLSENGGGLSGGQRQRLNIARALYRDPPILVMDEATSALDSLSEKVVMQNTGQRSGKTTVIIAHRLNTIINADRIYALDQGEIVEFGTHHDLMAKHGLYFKLFRNQMTM